MRPQKIVRIAQNVRGKKGLLARFSMRGLQANFIARDTLQQIYPF
jgi:hypothetical protein